MAKFWLCAAVGLYLLQLCLAQISLNISCRYAGVFHVEKNRRYSLTREEAIELCKALNSTLPTWEQMKKAFDLGWETCRYGYIEEKIVVPRHNPYHLCAANMTGIYVLQSNISDRYDTYCFNSSETRNGKVCEPVRELYSSWPDDQSTIEISNADGTRYLGGKSITDPPPITDDDSIMGSGSANDRGTTDPSVIRHHTTLDEDAIQVPYGVHPTDDISPRLDDSKDHNSNHGYEGLHPQNTSMGLILQDGNAEEVPTSASLSRTTAPGWDTNEIEEQYTSTTTVVFSSDVKHEDSSRDLLVHVVHSGWDNEVKYSANDTRDDTLPGTAPPGTILELIQNIIKTAVSSSDSFFKQKVSTPDPREDAHSGLEAEATFSSNTTTDDLHLGLIPSDEKEKSLEEEAFHTAVFINGSTKDEESHQDQLLPVGKPGGRRGKGSSTNRTSHGVVQILIPPSESDRENESAETVVVSTDGTNHEDSDHDHLGWDSENRDPKNASRDVIPAVISLNESKNEKDLETDHTAVLSHDDTTSEDSAHDIMLHREHSDWDSEDKFSTNTSRDHSMPGSIPPVESEHANEPTHAADPGWDRGERHQANESTHNVVPGIIFPVEHEHEKETLHTVVDSADETKHEDVTDHPAVHDVQHEWGREDEYPTHSSKDEEGFAIFPPPENNNEEGVFHTADIYNHDAHNEDATKEPLLPVHQPGWDMEEEYATNTSRNDVLMGGSANSGSKHDSLHRDVVSHDGTKDEDSIREPVKHDSEDKYSTNSTKGVLPSGIVPRRGTNHKNNTYYTGLDLNQPEDRGSIQGGLPPNSQPRAAHIPDWLIVVASLVALALILGVCIAVNSRRRCGQKQKLVINNGKGVEDNKNMGGLNGEASKSHEMVHLVHKEQPEDRTGPHDEFLQVDETNNLQEIDLKSGV